MHTGAIPDSAGEFSPKQKSDRACHKCCTKKVEYEAWDSSDGAYTDYKYTCTSCGYVWWVDGIDS